MTITGVAARSEQRAPPAVEREPAISVRGLTKRYGDPRCCTASTWRSGAVSCSRSSGRTAPGRPRWSRSSRAIGAATEGLGDACSAAIPRIPRASGGRGSASCCRRREMPAELTAGELVERFAGYYPHPRPVGETLELVGLGDRRDARAGTLSGGQRRRLDVAMALVGDPELLFLDEPTTGFDPSARHQAWSVISRLRTLGKTIVLTTHYMEEAEALADRVAVVVAGRIVAEGIPETLGGRDRRAGQDSLHAPRGLSTPSSCPTSLGGRVSVDDGDHVEIADADLACLGGLLDWARDRAPRSARSDGRASEPRGRLSQADGRGPMSDARLVWHEFRYERRAFLRDPQALFFSVGLPLLYVVIFVSLFGNEQIDFVYESQPGPLKAHTLMLAGFVSIGVISATFFNLAVTLVGQRENGILKRFRGTPLPTWGLIAGRVGTSIVLGIAVAGALLALGRVAYGIPVPLAGLPALLLVLLLASAAFCCLGFAFTLVVGKASAAVPLGTGVTLALYFLSGNFFIIESARSCCASSARRSRSSTSTTRS